MMGHIAAREQTPIGEDEVDRILAAVYSYLLRLAGEDAADTEDTTDDGAAIDPASIRETTESVE